MDERPLFEPPAYQRRKDAIEHLPTGSGILPVHKAILFWMNERIDKESGCCFFKRQTVADRVGCSLRTIDRRLGDLKVWGLVVTRPKPGWSYAGQAPLEYAIDWKALSSFAGAPPTIREHVPEGNATEPQCLRHGDAVAAPPRQNVSVTETRWQHDGAKMSPSLYTIMNPPDEPSNEPPSAAQRESSPTKASKPLDFSFAAASRRKSVEVGDVTIPPELDTPVVRQALGDWLQHRRNIHKGYKTAASVRLLLDEWVRAGPAEFVAAVKHSIAREYQGLFPPNGGRADHASHAHQGWNKRSQ